MHTDVLKIGMKLRMFSSNFQAVVGYNMDSVTATWFVTSCWNIINYNPSIYLSRYYHICIYYVSIP